MRVITATAADATLKQSWYIQVFEGFIKLHAFGDPWLAFNLIRVHCVFLLFTSTDYAECDSLFYYIGSGVISLQAWWDQGKWEVNSSPYEEGFFLVSIHFTWLAAGIPYWSIVCGVII